MSEIEQVEKYISTLNELIDYELKVYGKEFIGDRILYDEYIVSLTNHIELLRVRKQKLLIDNLVNTLLVDYRTKGTWSIEGKKLTVNIAYNYISPSFYCDLVNSELLEDYEIEVLICSQQ